MTLRLSAILFTGLVALWTPDAVGQALSAQGNTGSPEHQRLTQKIIQLEAEIGAIRQDITVFLRIVGGSCNGTNSFVKAVGSDGTIICGTVVAISATDTISDTVMPERCESIGQTLEGGVCVSVGTNALIASTSDSPSAYAWGSHNTPRGTADANNGSGNTALLASFGASAHPAAAYCANLSSGGFQDWYLPAKDELNLLFSYRDKIGNFSASYYWSSTELNEGNSTYAWLQSFVVPSQILTGKHDPHRVRCVRRTKSLENIMYEKTRK
ncbi:DUF1566 domain-containing protein [Ferrovibrio sp. MS7]|uniref:Lcl C-terminal domain-containing protein n=1 Tax=Ferrovibrio plantarum TaxID=3119164 RepID=UPI003134A00A